MPQPVVHFEISTRDRAKITGFFSQLFGWQVKLKGKPALVSADSRRSGLAGSRTKAITPSADPPNVLAFRGNPYQIIGSLSGLTLHRLFLLGK